MPLLFFHTPSNPLLSFFFNNQLMCGCGSVTRTQCEKERVGVLWNGQKAGGLSLRVKRDERVGVWWLDGVDVSVMAWCQTLCHCQCQPRQPISQWSATAQCVSKAIVFVATSISVLVLLCCPTFVQSHSHWHSSSLCCLHHELCLCWVCWCVLCDVK